MKKLLSAILVFCLLIVPFGAITAYAENTVDVTLTGFVEPTGFNAGNNHHVIYFSTSAPVPGGDGHAFTCGWPPITVKKVAADGTFTTETFGVIGGPTSHHSGLFLMIPADKIPSFEDMEWGVSYFVTFPKGLYDIVDADSANFTDDYTFMINHQGYFTQAEMASVSSTVVKDITNIPAASSATGLYFNVGNVAAMPSAGDWMQAYVDLNDGDSAVFTGKPVMRLTHADGTVSDFNIGYDPAWRLKKISDSQFYLGGFGTAVAGDVLTLDGYFYARNAGTWNYNDNKTVLYHFNNLKFAFDGTAWSDVTAVTYAFQGDFNGVLGWASTFSTKDARWNIYLTNDFGIDSTWDYKYNNFAYEIDGVTYTTQASSTDINGTLYFSIPASVLPGDAEKTVTVKAGGYLANGRKDKNLNVLNDFSIVASDAHLETLPDSYQIGDIAGFGGDSSATAIYFFTDSVSGLPASWDNNFTAADDDSGILFNDEPIDAPELKMIHSGEADTFYLAIKNTAMVGDYVTIGGTFKFKNSTLSQRITIPETVLYYNGTEWTLEEAEEGTGYTCSSLVPDATAGYFLAVDDVVGHVSWDDVIVAANNAESGIFVNGAKVDSFLKRYDNQKYYFDKGNATLIDGDTVVIKGTFVFPNNETVTFSETELIYCSGAFLPFMPNEITLTLDKTLDIVDGMITTLAFVPSEPLTGYNAYDTFFANVVVSVNGTDIVRNAFIDLQGRIYISVDLNVNDYADGLLVSFKKYAGVGYNQSPYGASECAVFVTEDSQDFVDFNYSGSAPTVDYQVTSSGGDANGVYVYSVSSLEAGGWEAPVVAADDSESGIFLNGEKVNAVLKNFDKNRWYISLSDGGVAANDGDKLTITGRFVGSNFSIVFAKEMFVFKDGKWMVTSNTEDIGSSGILGDANGDNAFNVADLVRLKKYIAGLSTEINLADADFNGDGKATAQDVVLMKMALLGKVQFEDGANITGMPTYGDDKSIRLAAYIGPTKQGEALTAADQNLFDDYAAAGLNTLLSAGMIYGNSTDGYVFDGIYQGYSTNPLNSYKGQFDTYMKLAANAGLDVLVASDEIDNEIQIRNSADSARISNVVTAVSKYDNFRGFILVDEPTVAKYGVLQQVTSAIKQANPSAELMTSFLPIYADNPYYFSADASLDLSEKYASYVDRFGGIFGDFTYDYYPFYHKYNYKLGNREIGANDYIKDSWFKNLELVAKNAHGKATTGITVQSWSNDTTRKDYYRDVNRADISFQVYTALAYGVKSVNYFTYNKHYDAIEQGQSMLDADGNKTDLYYAVKSVNEEISAFDNVLMDFNWQGTIGISGNNNSGIMGYVSNHTCARIVEKSASDDAIIGCLKDSNGYEGFMLVNATDPSDNVTNNVSVTFNNADHAIVYTNGVPAIVELTGGVFATSLTPGQGVFVIPYIA